MRKVAGRLEALEERYKDLPHQERAKKINEELKETFCVGEREIRRWKGIVEVVTRADNIVRLPPSHYVEIAKLPEEKQKEVIEQVAEQNLTYLQTAQLVREKSGKVPNPVDVKAGFQFEPEISNLWIFDRCDERFGGIYPGRMPGQIVLNLLYYYTHPADVVVDPFAGSGTTIDTCRVMERRVHAFDLHPIRADIQENDSTKQIPLPSESADFILLDPPYATMKKGEYSDSQKDLANYPLDDFLKALDLILCETWRVLKTDGRVAIVTSSLRHDGKVCDLAFECQKRALNAGFHLKERIIAAYGKNEASYNGAWIEQARKSRFMLRAYRDVLVFYK